MFAARVPLSGAYNALNAIGRNNTSNFSLHPKNKMKNRYGNIPAYDHSRVILPVINNDPSTDYINANWVPGYKSERQYIASQGPVPDSFVSFWRMVWLTKTETIVMVTHEVEGGRMKCHRYWPDPTSSPPVQSLQYGNIIVTHLSSIPHKHFVVRTFTIASGSSAPRNVKQFSYTSWPDHGVPLTTAELLGFRNAIVSSTTDPSAPKIVHCSAGVGRTGTFIALDTLLEYCMDMGDAVTDAIDPCITKMRMARNFMIQTELQYIYVYRALLDGVGELLIDESEKVSRSDVQPDGMQHIREMAESVSQQATVRDEAIAAVVELLVDADQTNKDAVLAANETNGVISAGDQDPASGSKRLSVGMTIKDRMKLLDEAEDRWVESYKVGLRWFLSLWLYYFLQVADGAPRLSTSLLLYLYLSLSRQASLEEWNARNSGGASEDYDLTSTLTPLQSRIEALKQKGVLDANPPTTQKSLDGKRNASCGGGKVAGRLAAFIAATEPVPKIDRSLAGSKTNVSNPALQSRKHGPAVVIDETATTLSLADKKESANVPTMVSRTMQAIDEDCFLLPVTRPRGGGAVSRPETSTANKVMEAAIRKAEAIDMGAGYMHPSQVTP